METITKRVRTRLIAKRGSDYFTVPVADIVYALVESKIVYLIDKNGRKYMYDRTLYELQDELD